MSRDVTYYTDENKYDVIGASHDTVHLVTHLYIKSS